MLRRPPRSTRTDTLVPDTTLFRSPGRAAPHSVRESRGRIAEKDGGPDRHCRATARVVLQASDRSTTAYEAPPPRRCTATAREGRGPRAGRPAAPGPGRRGSARNRTEERRVGKECVRTGRYRRSPYH